MEIKVGDVIEDGGTKFVVNRVSPTFNKDVLVRLQVDCMAVDEVRVRLANLQDLLNLAGV